MDEPVELSKVIDQLKATTDLGRQLAEARIWEEWPSLAPGVLAHHGYPVSVKDKVLNVEVDSHTWMHRYAFKKWDIVKRINRMARQELISDIFIRLAPDPEEPL
jgi:predicted nucleic acid-binding Zn ribbon protein